MTFICALVAVAALFSGAHAQAAPAPAQPSVTITPADSHEAAVQALAARGITNQAGDPSFASTDPVTRGEMAVYLARALHLPDAPFSDFIDVEPGDWGSGAITALHRARVMDGTSVLTFSPDGPVSRQEAASLLVVALRYSVVKQGAHIADSLTPYRLDEWLAGFKDRRLIDPDYVVAVAVAYRVGLFDIPPEGWFLPSLSLPQEELAPLLERAFVEKVATRTSYPTPADAVDAYPKLSRGSTGALVLLLQERLTALNYPCGAVDGKYASQTRDGVLAFEKYVRLKRTGVVDGAVWQRLLAAQAPTPVFQKSGRRIEIDLTRQILMMIVDDKVIMTIHVSTGKHGTPTATWHIRTRSKGWRMCSLGPIYSPCYFSPHDAIHGYGSVPTYPASHGCVRTPLWVQDSLVAQIVMGMPVDVFYNKAG